MRMNSREFWANEQITRSSLEKRHYIPLLRLADRGLISSRKEFVTGKRFRTYYHIEELGRRYLAYGKERYKLLTHHVNRLLNWEESANEKPQ